MDNVERKYEPVFTRSFEMRLRKTALNEFEKRILKAAIEYFCTSLDKSIYNPVKRHDGVVFYEFDIPIMFRNFRIVFEVDGINAYALDFEEV